MMIQKAKEVLSKIEDKNFNAYMVGGFPRDYYLNIESKDVDICTNATPVQLSKIFDNLKLDNQKYGSVSVEYKGTHFEITTFRTEKKYKNSRKPLKIKYIQNLKKDLKRRDFTINALCINKEGTIIDPLKIIDDINSKKIKSIGNPNKKFKEDALRMLRGIRFVSKLGFDMDENTKKAIYKQKSNLKKLSNNRKKEELNKIFTGKHASKAIKLITDLRLEKELNISSLKKIVLIPDILAIWAQIDLDIETWPFSKTEKEIIKKIKELLKLKKVDNYTLYKEGLYICGLVCKIKKQNFKALNKKTFPIKDKKDIKLSVEEICGILKINKNEKIKQILDNIEKAIILGKVENTKKDLKKYLVKEYKML